MPPFIPGPRGVDVIRYCYSSFMRFYDDASVLVPVRWWPVESVQPLLGLDTSFGSALWVPDRDRSVVPGRGELPGSAVRSWVAPSPPPVVWGSQLFGTPEMFAGGVPSPPSPPLPCSFEGIPTAALA